MQAFMAVN